MNTHGIRSTIKYTQVLSSTNSQTTPKTYSSSPPFSPLRDANECTKRNSRESKLDSHLFGDERVTLLLQDTESELDQQRRDGKILRSF